LPEDLLEVVKRFDQVVGMKDSKDSVDPFLDGNQWLEEAIKLFHQNTTKENLIRILEVIRRRMHEDGHLLIPVEPPKAAFDMLDVEHIQVGDTVQTQEDLHFSLRRIETNDGRQWLVAFTNQEEQLKGESTSIISNFIDSYLEAVLDMEDIAGIIINPWGQQFLLDKNLIQAIFDADKQEGM
jgi:hypothetical protein